MKKRIASAILVSTLVLSTSVFASDKVFTDVDSSNPYASYILDLQSIGLTNGTGNGQFSPSTELTRAEFAKFIVSAFNLPLSSSSVAFEDVQYHWAAQWIESAYEAGLIKGISTAAFEPDAPIKREDATLIVWRYLNSHGVPENSNSVVHLTGLVDNYAADAVTSAESLNLYGVPFQGNYTDMMTRQEAAALIDLSLKQLVLSNQTNTTALSGSIQQLDMKTADAGWGIQNSNGQLDVLRTDDGARSWNKVTPPLQKEGTVVGATFTSDKDAFVAQQVWPTASGETSGPVQLDVTNDGGLNWKILSSISLTDPTPVQSVQVDMTSLNHGYLMIQPQHGMSSEPGLLYTTEDGGQNWSLIASNWASSSHNLPNGGLIQFRSDQNGWLVASECTTCNRQLYETSDAGNSWTPVMLSLPSQYEGNQINLLSAPFSPPGSTSYFQYATLMSNDNQGMPQSVLFQFDSDKGNWSFAGTLPNDYGPIMNVTSRPSIMDFVNGSEGFVFGTDDLYETQDGGQNWQPLKATGIPKVQNATSYLQEIDFVSPKVGWILWESNPISGQTQSTLYQTTDGGKTFVQILQTKLSSGM